MDYINNAKIIHLLYLLLLISEGFEYTTISRANALIDRIYLQYVQICISSSVSGVQVVQDTVSIDVL